MVFFEVDLGYCTVDVNVLDSETIFELFSQVISANTTIHRQRGRTSLHHALLMNTRAYGTGLYIN